MEILPIAHIENGFEELFGIPRQSGIAESVVSRIVFEKEYSDINAFRELDSFSHIWLIWEFNLADKKEWSPTVRPPKLGGNKRVGVFASRSPYRPNKLGLSSVKILKTAMEENNFVIYVTGADLADKTPIFDIKPYVVYSDCHPDAMTGFSLDPKNAEYSVVFSSDAKADEELKKELTELLQLDPRPGYKGEDNNEYKMKYKGHDISFSVNGKVINVLTIC